MTGETNKSGEIFGADWWNKKLDTKYGEEIAQLLKLHEYPLVLRPGIGGLEFVVRHIFSRFGAELKEVIISHDIALVRKALRAKVVEESFHDIANRHKLHNLGPGDFPALERVHGTFGKYWESLEEKWDSGTDAQEKILLRQIGARLTFQYLLSDMVVFASLGKRDIVSDYLCCLELFQKGNYILGKLRDGSCLVVTAPDTAMN